MLVAKGKVQLGATARWYMTRLFIVSTSSDFVNQGMGMFVPSAPEADAQVVLRGGSAGLVLEDNVWAASTTWFGNLVSRAPGYPGNNDVTFLGPKATHCSADPAAPPQQRCWQVAGTCITLVLEARVLTDPSVPLSSSLPKHYTLHMLDTAIFIGSASASTTPAGDPAGALAAENGSAPAARKVVSATVATGREFALALANASVTEVVVSAAAVVVNVTDSDFEELPLPVWVRRNVTVRSDTGRREDWPLLALNAVGKVALDLRTTIKFTRVALQPLITEFSFRAPSLALFAASPATTPATAGGGSSRSGSRVLVQDAALIFSWGWQSSAGYKWVSSLPRPASVPGLQIVEPFKPWRYNTTGCLNNETAPPLQRCYKGESWFVDVVIEAADIDRQTGVTSPLNYNTVIYNTVVTWQAVLPDECMDELDPLQCYLKMKQRNVTLPSTAAAMPASFVGEQQAPAAAPGSAAPTTGLEQHPDRSADLATIIGCTIGGAAALVSTVAGVAVLLRHRRVARAQQKQPQQDGRSAKRKCSQQDTAAAADDLESPVALGSTSTMSASPLSKALGTCGSKASGGITAMNSSSCSRSGSLRNLVNSKSASGLVGGSSAAVSSPMQGRAAGSPLPPSTATSNGGGSGGDGGEQSSSSSGGGGEQQQPSPLRQPTPPPARQTSAVLSAAVAAAVVPATPFRHDLDIHVEVVESSAVASAEPALAPAAGIDSSIAAVYANVFYDGPSTHEERPRSIRTRAAAGAEVQLLPNVLGKGAHGRVMEGRYHGQPVAVKLLLGPAGGDAGGSGTCAEGIEAFIKEVEVLGRIDHPNVVKLLAACVVPPRLALVMELMECSLERLVFGGRRGPPEPQGQLLPLPKLLHIAIQLAQGLSHLHPTVLHRDLPANVLLRGADSDAPEVKITDFGLARIRLHTLPTANPEVGTPGYMAPELYHLGTDTVTHFADMYSFAVLVWVMLTGRQPWQGYGVVAMAYNVSRGARLPLDDLVPERCPPKLARLIRACWDADPRRRPAAAEALKELVLVQEQLLVQKQEPQGPHR
ncbi:hypothetical protein HYH02_002927 [Chlamydomonas schloesseri]|uniref:Protein kinase domain-containing protein n=1 Tax=Chlamydomonas schloesseri TaxID=2026947 RepID=A0A835WS62_9CHLO|nr:hypothetical protein HYH02_002927 [Chlamydomonas schloesseri]|eukprot:KAG2452695.1 hypothetical protein HYH02_002927 [Chlamydomonas schloesseri]